MEILYKGLCLSVPEAVYQPAEDSYLLADAAYPAGEVLEVGCGSGIVALSWARQNSVLGVDINPEAVQASSDNAHRNGLKAKFAPSDLFSEVEGRFDAILFNPPYLPTSEEERVRGELNRAFDGGRDGREVLDRFLQRFEEHLKPGGTLLLVQSTLNDPDATVSALEGRGFRVEIAGRHEFFFEKLLLLKASKK